MAVPALPAPAAAPGGLLLLVFIVGAFAVVIVVCAVVLALIQAVLPGGDTEADKLREHELAENELAAARNAAGSEASPLPGAEPPDHAAGEAPPPNEGRQARKCPP